MNQGNIALIHEKQGQSAEALRAFVRARETMSAISPGNPQWKDELAWYERQIAELQAQARRGAVFR